jgi:hypothetical protein
MLGERAPWSGNYYAGTFSEYDMGAVRYPKQDDNGGRFPPREATKKPAARV